MTSNIEQVIGSLLDALADLVAELVVAKWQSIEMWTDLIAELQEAIIAREDSDRFAIRLANVDSLALGYGRGAIREYGIADQLVDAVQQALRLAKAACMVSGAPSS